MNSEYEPTFSEGTLCIRSLHPFVKDGMVTDYSSIVIFHFFFRELQAFITEYPTAKYHASKQQGCTMRIINTYNGKGSYALFFQKGSPWKELVSKKILEYRESGILVDFYNRWMQLSCTVETTKTDILESFGIYTFGGLLLILICSFAVTLIFLLLENFAERFGRCFPTSQSFTLEVVDETFHQANDQTVGLQNGENSANIVPMSIEMEDRNDKDRGR